MSETLRFQRVGRYYDDLVECFGVDPRACDYGRPETQARKFDVLTQVAPLDGKSVLEVGCGFADLARFIQNRGNNITYTGIDLSPRMVAEAQRLAPDASIRRANVLDLDGEAEFDLVFAVGVFYLLGDDAEEIGARIIERMYRLAREAVAFSTLSSLAPDQEEGEFYWGPAELVRVCSNITSRFVLRHEYHPRDMTVFLYKQ